MKGIRVLLVNVLLHLILIANTQTLTDSLVVYYPFNCNAKDKSGNGNHGIVYGATLTTDRFGQPNSAYKFDGVNDYIVVDGSGRYDQHTITLWFKTTVGSYRDWTSGILFTNNYGATGNRLGRSCIYIRQEHLRITGGYNEPSPFRYPYTIVESGKGINDDKWHFVAAYFNSKTNEFKLYFDGKFLGSNSRYVIPLDLKNNNSKNGRLEIGARTYKNVYYKGVIDDVRIFNCELSEKEVIALANEQPNESAPGQEEQNCITKGKPVNSNGRPGYSNPKWAFDCNFCTNWNAGQYKPRWLSVDLEDTIEIKHLRFYVVQSPKGLATHQVYTSLDMKTWKFEEEFTLNTCSGDIINRFYYPTLKNVRGLKILTTKSPSWVAWSDIVINPTDTLVVERRKNEISKATEIDTIITADTVANQEKKEPVIKASRTISVKNRDINIWVWDYRLVDKDTITLKINDEIILEKYGLKKQKKLINYTLSQKENILILIAENLGEVPPNTASIIISDGLDRYEVILESSYDISNGIKIIYKFESK